MDREMTLEEREMRSRLNLFDVSLSYSAINTFTESPFKFLMYKLKKFEATEAMKFGSMMHMAILEEDKFYEHYMVLDRSQMPYPESTMNKKENKQWKQDMLLKAEIEGKELVDSKSFEIAQQINEVIWNNKAIREKLMLVGEVEKFVERKYRDFYWRGKIDAIGDEIIIDLKKVTNANPNVVRSTIFKMGMHRQAWLYKYMSQRDVPYFILAVDASFGCSLVEIKPSALEQGKRELDYYIDKFTYCCLTDNWEANYDYWSDKEDGTFDCEFIRGVSNWNLN